MPGVPPAPQGAPPAFLLGRWQDDYGSGFVVSATEWLQLPSGRYHVLRWYPEQQYLVARNDAANSSAPGRWTRIDWMTLPGMPPWTWAFCFSAYDAPTADSAAAVTIARRDTPRVGCNGYPFSRMKPASDAAPQPHP